MIEREDFAAGTSSRSTKLVHGGVRYLEKVRPSSSHTHRHRSNVLFSLSCRC
jgi:glycerol-3-phosphate dehydrogenase